MLTELNATVVFITTEEGGRFTPPASGVRPQLRLTDGTYTTCILTMEKTWFELGKQETVKVYLPFADKLALEQIPTQELAFYEGSKLVALGQVT